MYIHIYNMYPTIVKLIKQNGEVDSVPFNNGF